MDSLTLGISFTASLIVLLVMPLLYAGLGREVVQFLLRTFSRLGLDTENESKFTTSHFIVVGLLFHLSIAFLLKLFNLPWLLACGVTLAIPLWRRESLRVVAASIKNGLHPNFLLWFVFVLFVGVSLFDTVGGLRTPWANNYGDLPFHLGMITSFVYGNNFPPEYHILAGDRLTYPLMINFWTATLWWPAPNFHFLSVVFLFQWVLLWCLVYRLLNGDKFWLLPWAVVFGGGTYSALSEYSWPLITKSPPLPWAVFISTIWVTQRSALFGAVALLAALSLVHQSLSRQRKNCVVDSQLIIGCFIVALSPLVHTHLCLVAAGILGMMVLIDSWSQVRLGEIELNNQLLREFGLLTLALAPGLLFLPWILGKQALIKPIAGWTVSIPYVSVSSNILSSIELWLRNAPIFLLLMAAVWLVSRRHIFFVPLLVMFIFGNTVQLAEWDWDQIKVFIGIYLAFLLAWAWIDTREARSLHLVCLFLILPGAIECAHIFVKGEMFPVYTGEEVALANKVRMSTDPESVIHGTSDHNSILTLTGRKLFYGYEGTLVSHALNFGWRRDAAENIDLLPACRRRAKAEGLADNQRYCPQFLLWSEREKQKYNRLIPGSLFNSTQYDFLYEVPLQEP